MRKRTKPWSIIVLCLGVILLIAPGVIGAELIGVKGESEWSQALEPRRWVFPQDHGAHPEYRTEWWYFTGNLSAPNGHQYGYQLTFFRQGVKAAVATPASAWGIRDLYFAHFTITDVKNNQFRTAECLSRAGPGLAGARTDRMEIWILNWIARMDDSVIYLAARKDEMELDLELRPGKPLIFHGENGLSKKGRGEGQASYYTSFTDLETRGRLRAGKGNALQTVTGTSWFDHEFGSNQLTPDQAGWDWFSLHLSDGRDLMVYLLRRKDASIEPESSGTLVEANGISHYLPLSDISVSVSDRWISPHSGARYPSEWRIRIPSAGIDLVIAPLVADQELNLRDSLGISYWEGAVKGKGLAGGKDVSCEGYAELTGYAGNLGGTF